MSRAVIQTAILFGTVAMQYSYWLLTTGPSFTIKYAVEKDENTEFEFSKEEKTRTKVFFKLAGSKITNVNNF